MRTRLRSLSASTVLVLVLTFVVLGRSDVPAQSQAPQSSTPRLVVLLVLDQFPSEYFELYGSQWTQGLRRLLDDGAVFTEGAYPYGGTATCAGHSTIGTGSFPHRHGMVSNEWYDRKLDRVVTCEADPTVTPVPVSEGTTTNRHSAAQMMVPNLADELRRQLPRRPNIVSVAEKARSAIGLGGHGGPGTVVVWRGSGRVWSTSSAYTNEPWPDVVDFMRRNPMTSAYGQVWTKLLPESAYRFIDDDPSEPRPAPWGRTFPHTLHSPNGVDDGVFSTAWTRSPWADAFVVDFAINMLHSRRLGQENGTDMLALSLASLDGTGHQYGPRSHEIQDVLARVDVAIGRLLDALDRAVGRDNYVLALSADHGVARIPEQVVAEGGQGGRLGPMGTLTESMLQWSLGPGRYVGASDGSQISLTPAARATLQKRPDVKQALLTTLAMSPGVEKVFDREQLSGRDDTDDPHLRAWRLSYWPDRSGDLALIMKPGWIYGSLGANHGSQNPYDQRVPVMLYGAGIRKGRYTSVASPADLAPTLASVAGITLPSAEGRVLTEALIR